MPSIVLAAAITVVISSVFFIGFALGFFLGRRVRPAEPLPKPAKPTAWRHLTERPIYTGADVRQTYNRPT